MIGKEKNINNKEPFTVVEHTEKLSSLICCSPSVGKEEIRTVSKMREGGHICLLEKCRMRLMFFGRAIKVSFANVVVDLTLSTYAVC